MSVKGTEQKRIYLVLSYSNIFIFILANDYIFISLIMLHYYCWNLNILIRFSQLTWRGIKWSAAKDDLPAIYLIPWFLPASCSWLHFAFFFSCDALRTHLQFAVFRILFTRKTMPICYHEKGACFSYWGRVYCVFFFFLEW